MSTLSNCNNNATTPASYSIATLASTQPSTIVNALKSLNLDSCYLTPNGECNSSGCSNTIASKSLINCNCLTFFANMNAGVYTGLTCIMNTASASTNAIATSVQTINFSIVSPGDISNVKLQTNQNATAKVTTMTLTDTSNQDSLANISGKSILGILAQAKNDPTIFADPVSQKLIKAFTDYIATDPDALSTSVKKSVVSKISSITQVTAASESVINIMIENSTWSKLNAKLDQSTCISIIAQTIATGVVKNVTNNILTKVLGTTLDQLPTLCNPNYNPNALPVPSPGSTSNSTPTPNASLAPYTPAPKKGGSSKIIIVIIIVIILAIIGGIIYAYS
jgi:hypothetical protein